MASSKKAVTAMATCDRVVTLGGSGVSIRQRSEQNMLRVAGPHRHLSYHALFFRSLGSAFALDSRRFNERALLWKGGGGGLVPPTLSAKWALNPRLPAKVKTLLGVLGSQEPCDAPSFKATWFLNVIFTGVSALS